jgi:hypothetical protein
MAYPDIKFNNVTGSDTAASGAGPSTAITGTSAAHTNGVASTTITLTNSPDLSGVAIDGSAALWLNTASGRQWSMITAVDNTAKTVTVEDSFTIALASAVTYAIGGKRNTIDNANSKKLFTSTGAKAGWYVSIEYTGTDYTLSTGSWDVTTTGVYYRGTGGTPKLLKPTVAGGATYGVSSISGENAFDNLWFYKETLSLFADNIVVLNTHSVFYNCKFENKQSGTFNPNLISANGNTQYVLQFIGCEFEGGGTTGAGIGKGSGGTNGGPVLFNCHACRFKNCGYGIGLDRGFPYVTECEFINNSIAGVQLNYTSGQQIGFSIINSTFHENGIGIALTGDSSYRALRSIINCIFSNSSTWGISVSGTLPKLTLAGFNNFWNNGSGATTGSIEIPWGSDLALDPQYANAGGLNFAVGSNMQAKSFPRPGTKNIGFGNTATYKDLGSSQAQAAGGGLLLPRAMNGGYSA